MPFFDPPPKQPHHPDSCPRCTAQTEPTSPFCLRCKFDLRYGSPKSVVTGKCSYCDYSGALSKEHVFGLWLHNRYPKPVEQRWHRLSRPERFGFWEEIPLHHIDEPTRGSAYSVAVNNVCEDCNNGWLSRLHVEARSIVERFADGFWPRLSSAECKTLARWVIMITVNLERYARIETITQHQRDQLKAGHVPHGFRVSVGRMDGPQHAGYNFQRVCKLPIGIANDYLTFQSSFFCIENVGFHTISSFFDEFLEIGRKIGHLKEVRFPRDVWPDNGPPELSNKRLRFAVRDIENLQNLLS